MAGFFTGGVAGAELFRRMGYDALMAPATLTGLVGIGYAGYRQMLRMRQDADG